MTLSRSFVVACLVACTSPVCLASTGDVTPSAPLKLAVAPDASSSSSSTSVSLTDSPTFDARMAAAAAHNSIKDPVVTSGIRPFSAAAVALKFGIAGFGLDVATPLANKLNLRGSGSFFKYSPAISTDGININGTVDFRSVGASLDYYPFGGAFRLSPGLTFYNGNKLNAIASIPAGQTFTLNNIDYSSSAADPVHGTADVAFGNKVAPSLTFGFGNMLPRKASQHWSVPFEFGAEYIGKPTIALALSGTACQNGSAANCKQIAQDPIAMKNLADEQTDLNNNLSPLRFYPIISIGVSYKFGGTGGSTR